MTNRQVIETLTKILSDRKTWETFPRYLFILNNFLSGKTLSRQERSNHQNNNPRQWYLNLLAEGFGIQIDYDSPLFEGRIDKYHERYFYNDDSDFYKRFFKRLKYFRENNIAITEESLTEMLMLGTAYFNPKYRYQD